MLRFDKPVTFVGPTQVIRHETQEANEVARPIWGFLLLQNRREPILLEYGASRQAKAARRQMLRSGNAVEVNDLDLFNAIETALKHAFEQGVEQSVGLQEAFIKDVLEEGILHEGGDTSLQ